MTDNEIVKALEYCVNNGDCDDGCLCIQLNQPCINNTILLELIKRQQIEIDNLKISIKKYNKNEKFYEVVCSSSYLDIGLLTETDEKNIPKRIKARTHSYGDKCEYGGIEHVKWINTGIFLSEEEWDKITYNKSTDQIMHELGIVKR